MTLRVSDCVCLSLLGCSLPLHRSVFIENSSAAVLSPSSPPSLSSLPSRPSPGQVNTSSPPWLSISEPVSPSVRSLASQAAADLELSSGGCWRGRVQSLSPAGAVWPPGLGCRGREAAVWEMTVCLSTGSLSGQYPEARLKVVLD